MVRSRVAGFKVSRHETQCVLDDIKVGVVGALMNQLNEDPQFIGISGENHRCFRFIPMYSSMIENVRGSIVPVCCGCRTRTS